MARSLHILYWRKQLFLP